MSITVQPPVAIGTTAAQLPGLLDQFALGMLRICLPERFDANLIAMMDSGNLHPRHVLDLMGFDAEEILTRLVAGIQRTNLWQRYRLRRAVQQFTRNSFIYWYEQMQFPAPHHGWYPDAISAVLGSGLRVIGSEWDRWHASYRTGNKALRLPELLRTSNSRFISLASFINILLILQNRDSVNMQFGDINEDIKVWIDQHLADLAALWSRLPQGK